MNQENDMDDMVSADDGGAFDPRQAATLLTETRRKARRELTSMSPVLLAARGLLVLVAYAAVWWSVRDQHPYVGPTAVSLVVMYGVVVFAIASWAIVYRRSHAGVGGNTTRRRAEAAAYVAAWTAPSVFQGALEHAGASHAITYGIVPATLPLIVVGTAAAATCAARENWTLTGLALAVVAVACASAFAGPATVWLSMGIGLCLAVVAYAGYQAVELRRV